MTPDIKATLANLPDRPGVYLMKDARARCSTSARRRACAAASGATGRSRRPPAGARSTGSARSSTRSSTSRYTEVDSVSEALLLEANLIKRFKPRFNVRLKDDKSYPYIKITLGDDFPRIERTRKLPKTAAATSGRTPRASSVDEAMNLVRRLFPFRTCTIDIKDGERALARPCLLYHIKRCQGPCIEAISKGAYRRDIAQVELFLEGNAGRARRRRCATRWASPRSSSSTSTRRSSGTRSGRSSGRWRARRWPRSPGPSSTSSALARKDDQAAVQLFVVRNGKMLGRDVFLLDAPRDTPEDEVLASFLHQYYAAATNVPREVLVPRGLADTADLEEFLTAKRGSIVRLRTPQRGEKRELHGARDAQRDRDARARGRALARRRGQDAGALEELAAALGLPGPPTRIECYDISNFQGASRSAAWSCSRTAGRGPGEYRRFRIRTVEGPNDFASHQEVLRRRFRRAKSGEEGNEEERRWSMPDLVIIDGGKGQVSAAKEVLDELGLHDLPLAGPGEGARGAVPPRRHRAGPPADDLTGSLPGPAAARRGAPLRDQLPPPPAREAPDAARRSMTCRASAPSASASC